MDQHALPHDRPMDCPRCRRRMEEGFVPSGGGLHWLRRHDARNEFAQGLPGTASVEGRLRLPAWRCRPCELVMLRYGRDVRSMMNHLDQQNTPATTTGDDDSGGAVDGDDGGGGGGGALWFADG